MKNLLLLVGFIATLLLFSCEKQSELIIVEETVEESTNYELRRACPCGPAGYDILYHVKDRTFCEAIYGGEWWGKQCIICR